MCLAHLYWYGFRPYCGLSEGPSIESHLEEVAAQPYLEEIEQREELDFDSVLTLTSNFDLGR
jgi:hypothetical protein